MKNVDIAFMLVQAKREDTDYRKLIRLCYSGESVVLEAIAERKSLPEGVKLALITFGDDAVLDIVQEHDLTPILVVALAMRKRWNPEWVDDIDDELILWWLCSWMYEYVPHIHKTKSLSPTFKLLDLLEDDFVTGRKYLEAIMNDERIDDSVKFLANDQNPFN